MHAPDRIRDTSGIYSPALIFYEDVIRRNIAEAIRIAGRPSRLRPHVKTHKTREIVRLELDAGIDKHKCATLAEADMLASCEVAEVLIAYNMVGPNIERLARLIEAYPGCRFSVTADCESGLRFISEAMSKHGRQVEVLLDIDVGQHRTGVAPGDEAVLLYQLIDRLPGLSAGGLHVYDGHINHEDLEERRKAVQNHWELVLQMRERLKKLGLPLPCIVAGGTPTFPIYAEMDLPELECAPGTCFLHDYGYGTRYSDLTGFKPAAFLLTRVVSRPTDKRVTLDLGYKAVASDPPAGKRCFLLDLPEHEAVLQNEEHLVIETKQPSKLELGHEVYAVPTHICPTCAMHKHAYVVKDGSVTGHWDIVARDRVLTV